MPRGLYILLFGLFAISACIIVVPVTTKAATVVSRSAHTFKAKAHAKKPLSARKVIPTKATTQKSSTVSKPAVKKAKMPPAPTMPPAQIAAAQDALKSLRKMHAATAIGVSYADYHEHLIDTSADVTEDLRQVPPGDLNTAISNSLQAYVDAGTFWQKTTDILSSLPAAKQSTIPVTYGSSTATTALDAYNNDSNITLIQQRYSLQKVTIPPAEMQAIVTKLNGQDDLLTTRLSADTHKLLDDASPSDDSVALSSSTKVSRYFLGGFTLRSRQKYLVIYVQVLSNCRSRNKSSGGTYSYC